MRIRRSIFWFVVICAVLTALVVWFGKKPAETSSQTVAETNTIPPPLTEHAATNPQHEVQTNTPAPSVAATSANIPTSPARDKKEQMREGLATFNDVPIVFYGKLEDQFGSPVVGAEIAGAIRIYNGSQSTVQKVVTVSDANGLFRLKGEHGESLGMMPRKDGYALASTSTEFKYSYLYDQRHDPDSNNPVVIKMWKLQGAEPLVGIDQHYKLPVTGAPVSFDLLAGKIVPTGGDLRITVNRSPGVVSQRNPQDWSVQVEAVDGGLIETSVEDARVAYAAPDNGYQASDTMEVSTNNHWSNLAQQMFFMSSRNGQVFSKIFLSFGINANPDDPMSVTVRGVANANGSRNWEGDANTMKP